ncbi:MAG: right-handed parallel beta-helix repeat-containing protein [Phycisphaerales bacterium JB039]
MRPILAALVLALAALPAAAQRTIRVPSPEAMTIQAGVDLAASGDTVIISPGTHTGEGNREIQLRGKAITITSDKRLGLRPVIDLERQGRAFYVIRGEGPDTIIDGLIIRNGLREWKGGAIHIRDSSPTIRDCDFIDCENPLGGAIYAENSGVVIEGCVFRGCGSKKLLAAGGAAALAGGCATIAGCVFEGNFSDSGGAVWMSQAVPKLLGCVFEGSGARSGGALYAEDSRVTVSDSHFVKNTAWIFPDAAGGAVFANGGSLAFTDCTFRENRVHADVEPGGIEGDAVHALGDESTKSVELILDQCQIDFHPRYALTLWGDYTELRLISCTVRNNGWGVLTEGHVDVQACVFEQNRNTFYVPVVDSGARTRRVQESQFIQNQDITDDYSEEASFAFEACSFLKNSGSVDGVLRNCQIAGNSSFGIRGSTEHCVLVGNTNFTHRDGDNYNCEYFGNVASVYGLVYAWGDDSRYVNCTFAGNTSVGGPLGAATADLWGSPASLTLENCILYYNEPPLIHAMDSHAVGSSVRIHHSIVQGGRAAVEVEPLSTLDWGAGNLDMAPWFLDLGAGDLRLAAGSPGIDAGDNTALEPDMTVDLDGNPRFRDDVGTPDTGAPDPARPGLPIVDIGAYEFQGESPCRADLDGDGVLTFFDFVEFQNLFAAGDPRADFDCDGALTFFDFLAFQNAFAAGCP